MRNKRLLVSTSALLTLGMLWFGHVGADIRKTKHNFTAAAGQTASTSPLSVSPGDGEIAGPKEVCVFCHTPTLDEIRGMTAGQGGSTAAQTSPAPEWQRAAPASEYALYDDIGPTSSQRAAAVGSISVACLSCHDSNQALGVAPYENNHPFGVPYRGAALDTTTRQEAIQLATAAGDPFKAASYVLSDPDFQPARNATVNLREIWWVPRSESPVRTKEDLPVYPRRIAQGGESLMVPFIECTSCHDPHVERVTFLRVENAGSQLCLTCHIK